MVRLRKIYTVKRLKVKQDGKGKLSTVEISLSKVENRNFENQERKDFKV